MLFSKQTPIFCCHQPLPAAEALPLTSAPMFEEMGYRVTVIKDGPFECDPESVLFIERTPIPFPVILKQLVKLPVRERPFVVIWHQERLPLPRAANVKIPYLTIRDVAHIILHDQWRYDGISNYTTLRSLARSGIPDLLLVSTRGRQEYLRERGMDAHWVPYGSYPRLGEDRGIERDIDVIFLGSLKDRKRRRHLKHLVKRGVPVLDRGSWHDPACWGEERTKLLNRSKIFLNIPRTAGDFTGMRFALGMANNTLIVSEPVYDPHPYVPGEHFISVPIKDMPDAIEYYLAHEDERRRIALNGYRLVTGEVTLRRSFERIVELISDRFAHRHT